MNNFQEGTNQHSAIDLRAFGRTGLQVSALGFGGANIGFADISDAHLDRMFGTLLESGINVVDTAPMYGDSEAKIGRALRGRRQHILLFTKCGRCLPSRYSLRGFALRARRKLRRAIGLAEEYESLDWHPRAMEWSIDQSLRRLRTDYVDLIQLHSCSVETLRKPEVIEVLQRARKAGKVRLIGYSGEGAAAMYAIQSGQFQAVQISVNIADQKAIDTILVEAAKRGLGVIAKRPLANSLWKSGHRPDPDRYPHYQAYWDRLQKLQFESLRNDHAFETALRFTLSVPGVHTAIAGTTNSEHIAANVGYAVAGGLPRTQFDSIRARWSQVAEPNWVGQI
jgi:aryl-alcohol dehydrogenase-like predicted oxidoreductase